VMEWRWSLEGENGKKKSRDKEGGSENGVKMTESRLSFFILFLFLYFYF